MNIKALRQEIDKLDRKLVTLLNRRANYSLAIGRLKQRSALPLFIRKREQEIARNIREANRGPLPHHTLEHVFEQLLQHTRAMVRKALWAERRNAKGGAAGARKGKR
jgi:chorismate mutase